MILGFLVVLENRLEAFVYGDFVVAFLDFSEARVGLEPCEAWVRHWRKEAKKR